VGAALGVAVQHASKVVVGRLNRREEERVGAALLMIRADAHTREEEGERLRQDGFFDARGTLRPEAEDLLEATLRQAAETYEERKLPLLAVSIRLWLTTRRFPRATLSIPCAWRGN
jgi:hypothetical protein